MGPYREAPIDPPGGPLAEFAAGLRVLRARAGSPPYEVLARRSQRSASMLSIAASGRVMPSLPLTLAYVRACGGDPREWEGRWHALDAALNPGSDTPAWGVPAPWLADWSHPPGHTLSTGAPAITRPDGRLPDGHRPVPPPDGPLTSVRATERTAPRHRAARSYRRVLVTGGTAMALSGAALAVWVAIGNSMSHPRRASHASMPLPHAGRSARVPGTAPTARRRGGTAVAPSRSGTAAASPHLAGNGSLTAGPGCAPSATASGAAHTGTGGDGWIAVGGGPTECGGHALATYTTTGTRTVQDTYTWRFRTGPGARCTLRLFIPDTNPSSASARYDVYGSARRLGGFTVVQAAHKGRWVEEGTWIAFSGVLRLRLTDQADYAGAHHHVTASAVRASCH